MKKFVLLSLAGIFLPIGLFIAVMSYFHGAHPYRQWDFQSIDTMKYSRDLAREQLKSNAYNAEIDNQIRDIAGTGANYVAIGTPYDEEFLPVLKNWVKTARKYHLKVWFKGNFSGWEGWFGYKRIDKKTHIDKTRQFIMSNPDLFENEDIFTSCPECENGSKVGYGDTEALTNHKAFLLKEYNTSKDAFASINKNVHANFYSMNGDLAKALMDKETTRQFDGVVVVDHYVKDPLQLAQDLRDLAKQSGGTVILGEFGAPLPDLNGKMTEEEQMLWVKTTMREIATIPEVEGVNYWVNKDGTTAIWTKGGKPKPAVDVIRQYFEGKMLVIKYSN